MQYEAKDPYLWDFMVIKDTNTGAEGSEKTLYISLF